MSLDGQKIKSINLIDLNKLKFKVSIKEDIAKLILNDIQIKGISLYKRLNNLESQKYKKISSIKGDFLSKWKIGKRIPIDCFKSLCNLSKKEPLDYQKNIYELLYGSCKNGWKIDLPIKIDKKLFLISEAIRTEGNIVKGKNRSIQGIAISNKDVNLLKIIEKALNKLNIESGFSRILHIIIYLKKNNITKIINKKSKKELHFHYNNERLEFLEQIRDYKIEREYIIYTNKEDSNLKLNISNDNLLMIESDFKATSYLTLQSYNSVFARFLSSSFKIPYGIGNNKTYSIKFPFDINLLSEEILKTILDIVISCEGNVFYNKRKGDRHIKIKIASRRYLMTLKNILRKFDIDSEIRKSPEERLHVLFIRRKQNLDKLFNLVKLTVKYKQNTFKEIIKSYKYMTKK
ncbi:hypothetical protein GOV06_03710 [Candidatus Woesearchaeota archaeon]|nr:hypothetical protein [Candidatus Woesearchaeota archaeon]